MILDSLGTAFPPFGIQFDDRHQIAELYVNGDERDRWFVENLFEKSTINSRPSVLLTSSTGDLQERQSFFAPADEQEQGPTTAERMEAYQQHASQLGLESCRQAFVSSSIQPSEITHLVTASCTGFSSPGFDLELIQLLGLSPSVKRTHIGFMGCHAGLNCLRTADLISRAEPESKTLVCTVELCGLHYQYRAKPDQIVANSLFADGSGAAIAVGQNPSKGDANLENSKWKMIANGSLLIPETTEMMKWVIGDHGFKMTLSDQIPGLIRQHAGNWLRAWLENFGLHLNDVRSWAVHPGGPQILNAFEQSVGLAPDQLTPSRSLLREKGNMSSASVFFLIDLIQQQKDSLPCVAVGFGPGLTIEAALFDN